jgi:hypothetical protein
VKKGEEPMIKFAVSRTRTRSQPASPMKQTLVTKTTDEKGVVEETRRSGPGGNCTFIVKITDKVSV